MSEIRVESWCGYDIRFIEHDGEWWAILKDICDALHLRTDKVASRLDPKHLVRLPVESSDHPLKVDRYRGENRTRWMLAIDESGIYQALFASRRLEARKFVDWTGDMLRKLRRTVGLQGYEVMRMTEPEIQDQIDWLLDSIFYDEDSGQVMVSVTVEGGDVDQIPLDEYVEE